MTRIHHILFLLLLLPSFAAQGQMQIASGLTQLQDFTPWHLSTNPAGIRYLSADSALEAHAGYGYNHTPLSLSDRPAKEDSYGASVAGYNRFGQLQLTGGLSWQQDLRKGTSYNFLQQPDYLVAAGDTLGTPQRVEAYRIYGKAAYALTPSLTFGIGGDYTAYSNKEDSPDERYTGNAHTTAIRTGALYETRQMRLGISVGYTHRTELLTYGASLRERLYTYPLGYYLYMGNFNNGEMVPGMRSGGSGSNHLFRSTGNEWQLSADAEWRGNGWSWFNTLSLTRLNQQDNPDKAGNMKGWEEEFKALDYHSRLTLEGRRWTHRLSPSLLLKQGISDRILQHTNNESLSSAWVTFATYRLASRMQTQIGICYEAFKDYTPAGYRQAWEVAAGWYRHQEEFYSFPLTIAQTTSTLQGMIAFRQTIMLPRTSSLTIRPSFTIQTGTGVEEEISQPAGTPETQNRLPRSYARVSNDYAARTVPRLLYGIQMEYKKAIMPGISAGIQVSGNIDQITGQNRETGCLLYAGLVVWL